MMNIESNITFSLSVSLSGPVHVHNAGTVIFSLLNQFTGMGGGTEERGQKERDEEGCPAHPTPSPNIHLSQEERDGEMDCVFFPSQEQGKDSHVSKEEVQWGEGDWGQRTHQVKASLLGSV